MSEIASIGLGQNKDQLPVVVTEHALALDFDRTLGNTKVCAERLYRAAATVMDVSGIQAAQRQTEADGGSFDPLGYMEETLTAEDYRAVQQDYLQNPPEDFLNPGAAALLAELDEKQLPHWVLTYGVNPAWQELKVRGGGFKGHIQTLPHSRKGPIIESLRDNRDGLYPFRGYANNGAAVFDVKSRGVTLVDDKALSLKAMPADGRSVWLCDQPLEKLLPSQRPDAEIMAKIKNGEVEVIHSLGELVLPAALLLPKAALHISRFVPLRAA
jgi:hypothetical protein